MNPEYSYVKANLDCALQVLKIAKKSFGKHDKRYQKARKRYHTLFYAYHTILLGKDVTTYWQDCSILRQKNHHLYRVQEPCHAVSLKNKGFVFYVEEATKFVNDFRKTDTPTIYATITTKVA